MSVCLNSDAEALERALAQTIMVDDLTTLEQRAHQLYQEAPHAPRIASLIGAIIRRRLEWQAASDHFLSMAQVFPEILSFQYDAALTAIDAGNYKRGQEIILGLSNELEALAPRQLRGIWRAAPLVGLYDIALRAFYLANTKDSTLGQPWVEERLTLASRNASNSALQSVNVISIGENCLPWQLTQRWGLRSAKTMFEQESPFNLAQTTTDDIAHLLRNGMDQLIDVSLMSTFIDKNGSCFPKNKTYHFDFNHERGPQFIENCYIQTRLRYADRIKQMRKIAATQPAIYVHFTERSGDLEHLVDAVRAFAQSDCTIVIFDSWLGCRKLIPEADHVRYKHVAMPNAGYRWFTPDHYDSIDGLNFERNIMQVIREEMIKLASRS